MPSTPTRRGRRPAAARWKERGYRLPPHPHTPLSWSCRPGWRPCRPPSAVWGAGAAGGPGGWGWSGPGSYGSWVRGRVRARSRCAPDGAARWGVLGAGRCGDARGGAPPFRGGSHPGALRRGGRRAVGRRHRGGRPRAPRRGARLPGPPAGTAITAARPGVRPTSRNVRRFAVLAASTAGRSGRRHRASRAPSTRAAPAAPAPRGGARRPHGARGHRGRAPSSARSARVRLGAPEHRPAGCRNQPGPVRQGRRRPALSARTGWPAWNGGVLRATMCPSRAAPRETLTQPGGRAASATTARFSLRSARTWRGASVHCCS
ncbi:hypothetical protein SMICM17S_03406 [Streptomyces microflavus]